MATQRRFRKPKSPTQLQVIKGPSKLTKVSSTIFSFHYEICILWHSLSHPRLNQLVRITLALGKHTYGWAYTKIRATEGYIYICFLCKLRWFILTFHSGLKVLEVAAWVLIVAENLAQVFVLSKFFCDLRRKYVVCGWLKFYVNKSSRNGDNNIIIRSSWLSTF